MSKGMICVFATISAALLAGTTVTRADTTDDMLARVGQFQLDQHETKTVKRKAAVEGYRVCMEEGRHAVALMVTHDDLVTIVEPGECQLIEAEKIKLASAERLHDGTTLIGSFGSTSKSRQYKTNVSVARNARND